eukprot:scaffold56189_cov50-Phaeocystis_antarctica.AAC.2
MCKLSQPMSGLAASLLLWEALSGRSQEPRNAFSWGTHATRKQFGSFWSVGSAAAHRHRRARNDLIDRNGAARVRGGALATQRSHANTNTTAVATNTTAIAITTATNSAVEPAEGVRARGRLRWRRSH